jgi:hypothetical protein
VFDEFDLIAASDQNGYISFPDFDKIHAEAQSVQNT